MEPNWWALPSGPVRQRAKAHFESRYPIRDRPRRVKIDGQSVILLGDVVYEYHNKDTEFVAFILATAGIPPLPAGVTAVREGREVFLTDGRLRLLIDPDGSRRDLLHTIERLRNTNEQHNG